MGKFGILLLACALLHPGPVAAGPEKRVIDGVTYHILTTTPGAVKILWKDESGNPLRTFEEAAKHLGSQGIEVDTLMNGGIFEPGGVPSGLLIQNGKELRPVNRNRGEGNFFLKPNGIFLIGNQRAAIIDTDEYPLAGFEVRHAVQSGPLLLRRGVIHPAFNPGSPNRLHRNGVGITREGEVVLAMSDFHSQKFPNLHEFALLFRSLGCENALFLDGDLSQMRSGHDLQKPSNRFGSIIAVVRDKQAQGS